MTEQKHGGIAALLCFLVAIVFLASGNAGIAKTPPVLASQIGRSPVGIKQTSKQDDSFNLKPAADLVLHPEGERKAGALADFVEGMAFEENGETDRALEAYRKVLNVDPGQSDLAARVAALLIRQDDFPQAIDVLKDAIKANPNDDDPSILKDVADYYASSQQLKEAIPLYLRVLELQPDDANAREKLATGFILTNQRNKAVEMLEQIIKQHPEKYQPYDLLAQVLDDEARSLQRAKRLDDAKAEFAKVAANYEQSLLINPDHAGTYLRLAE